MRYTLRDVTALLRTPVGRRRFVTGASYYGWPVLAWPAALYRRTIARKTRVIAVTGSFGKTTTTRAIWTVLNGRPAPPRLTPNYKGFLALELLRIRPGQRHLVLEVGLSRLNQMADYARVIRPDIAVVTCIGTEHHRSFRTFEVTRSEKSHLVRVLPPSGTAVLNGDDPNVRWMSGQTRARVVTFGFDEMSDVRASELALDWPRGTRFRLATRAGTREVRVRLLGRPMVYPILAAVAVALEQGLDLDQAIAALETLDPTPARLQPVPLANGAIIVRDEFKSAQDTIEVALDVLEQIPAKRRIVVLGDITEPLGSQGPLYRHIGERVARVATRAFFIGDGAVKYMAGANRSGLARDAMTRVRTVGILLDMLRHDLGPGDVVLIKGREKQRLDRISLALAGRHVQCELKWCNAKVRCETCPMLERGWGSERAVT